MAVDGLAAARTLLGFRDINPGLCLHYVWQAYKAHGARVDGSWPTATSAWTSSPGKHHGDRNPPAGAAVWWGRRRSDGNMDGDVVISLGGGRVAATDYPGWRQTGETTLDRREAQINREYLGWTETILGVPIALDGADDRPLLPLDVDGDWGDRTTRALQQALGIDVDGDFGTESTKALQRALGFTGGDVDGDFGPATKRALQRALGFTGSDVDGDVGPQTIRALQAFLNEGRRFNGAPPAAPAVPADPLPLDVDGDWGARTTKALQRALGFTGGDVDGQLGPLTISALQEAIGANVDGAIGPQTTRHLQALIGADQDGQLGPDTIRALQTFLNDRKAFVKATPKPVDTPVQYPQPATPTYPGASWWGHSSNSSPRLGTKIDRFVIHHAAATADQRDRFMNPNDRSVSPTWYVRADGSVDEIVPPDMFRPWTTGQFDLRAVTVETQNTSGDPAWGVSEESHHAIGRLVAWAANRYGFPIDREHVIGHREVPGQATACPGPLMNLDRIVELARGYAQPAPPDSPPEPEIPAEPEPPEQHTPTPEEPPVSPTPRPPVTDEQLDKITNAAVSAAAAALEKQADNAPAVSDRVAKPTWIVGTLVVALIGPVSALTVLDYAHWGAEVAAQFSALVGTGVGLALGALGLSRYGKTKA